MALSPMAQNLWALGGLVFWTVAYILMIRRGIKDRSYSMPMVAICLDVAWEAYFTFFSDAPTRNRIGYGFYFFFDLGVLWTCLKFGPLDFRSPSIRKYFRATAVATFVAGFFLVRQFALSFADLSGGISATFTTLLLSVLLVGMILRRDSVQGQSLYIVLLILVGDICGWMMNLIAQQTVQPNISVPWIHTVNAVIIAANLVYLGLYLKIAKRDSVPLLSRF